MPKNRVCKLADGRYSYKWTDKFGNKNRIVSSKGEKVQAFKKRCEISEENEIEFVNMSFDNLFNKWKKEYQEINCGEADINNSEYIYEKFLRNTLKSIRISQISRADINKIITKAFKNNYSRSVLSHIKATVSRPYNWAIRELDFNIHNPADKIKLPKNSKINNRKLHGEDGERFIKRQELDRFFDAAKKSHYYNAYKLLYLTGLRPSECIGLRWTDIINGAIYINRSITDWGLGNLKTSASLRKIPLNEYIIDCLWLQYRYCKGKEISSEWVFPQINGNAPTMNSLRLAFQRARKQTIIWKGKGKKRNRVELVPRVNFSLYDFRHTFATLAAYRMPPKQLQYIMGHANIETTLQIYAKITKNQINDAGNIMSEMLDDHHK